MQRLANEPGLAIRVCHFPPGTVPRGTRSSIGCSPPITSNWRGKLPTELATIVNLIASTRHPQRPEGLSRRDEGSYAAKVTVPHAELEAVALQDDGFQLGMTPESREYLSGAA